MSSIPSNLPVQQPRNPTYGSVPSAAGPRVWTLPATAPEALTPNMPRNIATAAQAPRSQNRPLVLQTGLAGQTLFRSSPQAPEQLSRSQLPTSIAPQAYSPRAEEYRRAPFICEFVGTFLLAFTVCCCKFCGNEAWDAAVIGGTLMVLIYAVGPISGGSLNPAVSLTLAFLGKVRYSVAAGMVLVQIVGAVLGTALAKFALFSHAESHLLVTPAPAFNWRQAAAVEVLFTAMLCFVVANCTVSEANNPKRDRNQFFGIAIGFSAIAGIYAAGNISGGILNPAIALSLNNPWDKDAISWGFLYAGYELVGACVAVLLYYMCRPSSEESEGEATGRRTQDRSLGPCVASEFFGTFFLVATVGFSSVMQTKAVPLAAGAALISMVYSLGQVSGGHFNPAVTFAVVLAGRNKCVVGKGCLYVIAQVVAGMTAGLCVAAVHGFSHDVLASSILDYTINYTWSEALVAEIVFTTLVAYVVLAVTTSPAMPSLMQQNFYFALAVGAAYIVGGLAIRPISGGVLNPAVATGIATESSIIANWQTLWKSGMHYHKGVHVSLFEQLSTSFEFTMAELAGGALAAAIFGYTHPQEFETRPGQSKSAYRNDDPTSSLL